MMTESNQKEWAQLVCSTNLHAPAIPIQADNFSIGRAKVCDLSLCDNKYVSSKHCRLTRQEDGKTWLEDTSTNGTWVNQTKLTKGQRLQVTHGDEIFLVKRPGVQTLAYMFQEMAELDKEMEMCDETLEYDDGDESECTEEYKYDSRSDEGPGPAATIGGVKRDRQEDSTDEHQDAKRLHSDTESKDEKPESKGPHQGESIQGQTDPAAIHLSSHRSQVPGTSRDESVLNPGPSTTGSTTSTSETKPDHDECTGEMTAVHDERLLGATGGEANTDTVAGPGGQAADCDATPEEGSPQDTIAETLMCSICQDIFHDCISLQPCMHSFCAACYSSWMDMAKNCPTCRITVQRINKNHIVNNLVEAYLKDHSDKKRSEEELKEMDEKNKITREMLIPKQDDRDGDSYNSDDDESYNGHSDSDEDSDGNGRLPINIFGFGGAPHIMFPPRPARSICRHCPGYIPPAASDPNVGTVVVLPPANQPGNSSDKSASSKDSTTQDKPSTSSAKSDPDLASTSSSSAPSKADNLKYKPSTFTGPQSTNDSTSATCKPSTCSPSSTTTPGTGASGDNGTHQVRITPSGDVVAMPTAPVYQCNNLGNHLVCMCCQKPMPDRRAGFGQTQAAIPSQKCTICGRFFCHMYWGCLKIDCLGCLNKFKDMNFGDKCMKNFVNNNSFESEILKKHLQAHNKSWKDVLHEGLVKLDAGQYTCPDRPRHQVTSETPVCYTCGMKNFQQLAYQYRKDVPRDQLPAEVLSRSNCYWGKNCRTQFNKPLHAQRFNHICDQTRF
ncbi:E3 ubiquitin-protein ligase CHFR-like [Amphiura filiformis]|uniref:E3 ubiquitin-protein ligase CHFR-like n=1 Tax=Amphiura filiformis TaxID=82378 RepID=UPI003B2175ED